MTSGMPELGSKISLISKADIRYEGRLFTVDPQECTIALSSVRSFGTEDRDTPFKIAPQSQIYDYILFRGSDIKDIRVVNNTVPHPNDPAIMQVQLPNGQHLMPHFPMGMGNPPPPHGGPGTSGNSGNQNQGAFGNPFGNMAGLGNLGGQQMGSGGNNSGQSMAPGAGASGNAGPFMMGNNQQQQQQQQQMQQQQQQQQNKQMPQQQKQPISVLDMLADASRSTTPTSLISRKSPAGDMNLQHQQQQQHHQQQQQMLHHNQHNQNQANAGHGGNSRDAGHKRQTHPQPQQQQRGNRNGGSNGGGNGGNTDYYHHQQQQLQRMNNYAQYHDGRNNYNNQRNQNQNRAWTMHRGGPNNMQNNMMMRNRGGGGGGGRGRMPNQGYRPIGGVGGLQNKPRNNKGNTIKFEQDFDFEQANNKFEELRSQLSKLKVGDEPNKAATPATTATEQLNGETDKKDDSGNETGAGDHEHEDEEISVGYDKTKSFFDNISCEAAQDRSKNNKTNWRQERKLNSETFGVTSTRRGSYRGRPNYYNNRNANNFMGGGGGYNRGYRGGNNYRNRSNNRMGGNGGGMRGDGTNSNGNGGGSLTNVDIASAAGGAIAGGGTVSAPGTPTGGSNIAANLKNQATTNAGSDAPSATATPNTKSAILQENSQTQAVAAGGQ